MPLAQHGDLDWQLAGCLVAWSSARAERASEAVNTSEASMMHDERHTAPVATRALLAIISHVFARPAYFPLAKSSKLECSLDGFVAVEVETGHRRVLHDRGGERP